VCFGGLELKGVSVDQAHRAEYIIESKIGYVSSEYKHTRVHSLSKIYDSLIRSRSFTLSRAFSLSVSRSFARALSLSFSNSFTHSLNLSLLYFTLSFPLCSLFLDVYRPKCLRWEIS